MSNFSVTVAIATFNRYRLLGRAIQSVINQEWPNIEIIVVDDASTDITGTFIAHHYPQVRYFRQELNQGCGAARNRALRQATNQYVLILDDDDTLLSDSLALIKARLAEVPDIYRYPVVNFAHGNAGLGAPYLLAKTEDYLKNALYGDFVPVIRRELFLRENLMYPLSHVGGEHLLWWKIAERYGIPTWADRVGTVNIDAPVRLTSVRNQIYHAREHAEIQEQTLSEFAELLRSRFPAYYAKKVLGAATYRLLAGDRSEARLHLHTAFKWKSSMGPVVLWTLSFFPLPILKHCFLVYRRMTGAHV
jgi:GalNAc5-diNAcBac-PP-undecaprenol beta-1,3-glucosyltransferase